MFYAEIKAWVGPYSCGKWLVGVPQGEEPLGSLWTEGLLQALHSGVGSLYRKMLVFPWIISFEKASGVWNGTQNRGILSGMTLLVSRLLADEPVFEGSSSFSCSVLPWAWSQHELERESVSLRSPEYTPATFIPSCNIRIWCLQKST